MPAGVTAGRRRQHQSRREGATADARGEDRSDRCRGAGDGRGVRAARRAAAAARRRVPGGAAARRARGAAPGGPLRGGERLGKRRALVRPVAGAVPGDARLLRGQRGLPPERRGAVPGADPGRQGRHPVAARERRRVRHRPEPHRDLGRLGRRAPGRPGRRDRRQRRPRPGRRGGTARRVKPGAGGGLGRRRVGLRAAPRGNAPRPGRARAALRRRPGGQGRADAAGEPRLPCASRLARLAGRTGPTPPTAVPAAARHARRDDAVRAGGAAARGAPRGRRRFGARAAPRALPQRNRTGGESRRTLALVGHGTDGPTVLHQALASG